MKIKPLTRAELLEAAVNNQPIPILRVLATYADPNNWVQAYHAERSDGKELRACEWAFIGPTRPGYELAQWAISEIEAGRVTSTQSEKQVREQIVMRDADKKVL